MKKHCEHCNKEFEALSGKARFCSGSCKVSNHREKGAGSPTTQEPIPSDEGESKSTPGDLSKLLSEIRKDYGEDAIFELGKSNSLDVEVIPTNNILIDRATGIGGFPRGRIIEVYGPESSGKTTLCLTVSAVAQKAGGRAAFIDVEHALDPEYSKRLGVDIDSLLVSQPNSGEEALRIVEKLVRSNMVDVVVLDSVAALATRQEIEGDIGDATIGAQARLMSSALRKLTALIAKSKTCCIFTNQLREKVGIAYGNPEVTPGGKALKFYASMRFDIRRITSIKSGDEIKGNRTRIKVVKNKLAPPYKECEFDILYNQGISNAGSLIDLAIELGVLDKRGSWISFEGNQVAQGRDSCVDILSKDDSLYQTIKQKTLEKYNSNA